MTKKSKTRIYEFEEAGAVFVDRDVTPRRYKETRNKDSRIALKSLIANSLIDRFHFRGDLNVGVWTPRDIGRGKILRCDLPTLMTKDEATIFSSRNLLCLGVDVDPQTAEPVAIRAMRFSYQTHDYNPKKDLYIPASDKVAKYAIGGLAPTDKILRISAPIDIIPFNSVYWGSYVSVMGEVEESYMQYLEEEMTEKRNAVNWNNRNFAQVKPGKTIFLPSLEVEKLHEVQPAFTPSYTPKTYQTLSDAERDMLDKKLIQNDMLASYQRADHVKAQLEMTSGFKPMGRKQLEAFIEALTTLSADSEQEYKDVISYAMQNICKIDAARQQQILDEEEAAELRAASELRDPISVSLRQINALFKERVAAGSNDNEGLSVDQAMPTLAEIIEKAAQEMKAERVKEVEFQIQNADKDFDSFEALVNLGIGGLKRETDINLHKYLWQGRYHMLRIANLFDFEEEGENVNRPCVLTRAWVQPDKNGDVKLSHLAFIPCTRSQAKGFKYKLGVRPLDTIVKMPSYLIAEMEVIVPLNSKYFIDNQPDAGTFYELLPHEYEVLMKKKALAEEKYGEVLYHGMRPEDLPETCREIELPPPPDERMRKKFQHWGVAKFNIDAPSPIKRSMKGSKKTARNFRLNKGNVQKRDFAPSPTPKLGE